MRDEALLVLNDHLGHDVELIITVDQGGDYSAVIASATGRLTHWRAGERSAHWGSTSREDIVGLYNVGSASFDITELASAETVTDDAEPPYGLTFRLIDDDDRSCVLSVVWGAK